MVEGRRSAREANKVDWDGYPLLPETCVDGYTYGAISPLAPGRETGAGFLEAPDGSRCGLQWERSESPFIMKIEGPTDRHWGIYRVGFVCPVDGPGAVHTNLVALIDRLKILHARTKRVH